MPIFYFQNPLENLGNYKHNIWQRDGLLNDNFTTGYGYTLARGRPHFQDIANPPGGKTCAD